MLATTNLIGLVLTLAIYLFCILTFSFRLAGLPRLGRWFGYPLLTACPLIYLLLTAPRLGRPALYYVQIALMLAFLLVELLLDYVFKIDFRRVRWMTVGYVVLFFAATGGMLGVAAGAGRPWSFVAIGAFFAMAALAFIQRRVTCM